MLKYEKLKRKVLFETTVIMVALFALIAAVYFISTIGDDYESTNNALQKQVDALTVETNALRARFVNIQQNIEIYQEVKKKQEDGRLTINRDTIINQFNKFKDEYALAGMHLALSPVQDTKDALLRRKNSNVNFSEVNVSFDSVSDENVYRLIDALPYELPGVSKLIKVNMLLQKPFSEEVLQALIRNGTSPLIKTELQFIWFGINSIKKPDSKPDAPKN